MIDFKTFTLDNGLKVLVHEDHNIPTVVMNILYDVGSRDESENKTGFAHLFEHLMFGGSANIPDYDTRLQIAGGDNNAFTSPDLTNYYLTLPAENIETGFWLESDRMLNLSFDPRVLEVQRKVVIEEFKQRYLNQPYGDVWLKLRPLAYKSHPYKWATIGKDISHIENATMEDVKAFFSKYYNPSNAILVVAGNINYSRAKELSEKWFGPIPSNPKPVRNLPKESQQHEARKLEIESDVSLNAIYKAYKMCDKLSEDYIPTDLLSDIIGHGKSSRLYKELVVNNNIFSNVNAYITGSIDNGLFTISGYLNKDVSFETAENAIQGIIDNFISEKMSEEELQKVKNQSEFFLNFSEMEILSRAINLAHATLLGDPNNVNTLGDKIQKVTTEQINNVAKNTLVETNCNTLYYGNE